jgi:hypothetical protein
MKGVRSLISAPVALVLAAAIHVDWHLARHHARLSLGWSHHWLFAIPVFAAAAWYLRRRRPATLPLVSAGSIGAGILVGQGIEPLGEVLLYGAPLGQVYGPERTGAFAVFMAAGLATYVATLWVLRRLRLDTRAAPRA